MFIDIQNMSFAYSNSSTNAIENFTLTVNKGEIISILGRSGSGKSTILRLIAGLEMPKGGSFTLGDKKVFDDYTFVQPEKRGIGMVFQDYALFPHMSVTDNVLFGLPKMSRNDKLKRVKEVLELVELDGYEKRYPHQLSGGQQQRVALARAIAPQPELILLDEPFSNLDTDLLVKIREDLRRILKKANATAIFVTHNQNDAHALADRIVKIKDGLIDQVGRPCDLLGSPTDEQGNIRLLPEEELSSKEPVSV
ncbi:ABC transporter ATP-binding protein [Sporosarcina pasteurii]|uniref:Carnitine transport ATP-binding protein OpuCA n=1 Tax=Sporosarcina pasteurii TaxID=1474 RepID=A0A380BBD9_SPOPA|nr:ABC transporter ATP-binding protein [Sporosarcina pasteurii]MDS9472936.1 ABC transporter ATP-binding protein [Sporosarcina pasteurii]QBQ06478.1 ABC transporter ATP-binding protein [Sporosarcina pasteurii]SUI98376.1 Sulfate/thiosulfate import ATP-binding protein CysA [Sporosarcina pasteurii]